VTPDRLGINSSQERSPQVLKELTERRDRIRVPLLTLAHSHPSATVRNLAPRLDVEMANTLTMAVWFIRDLLRARDVDSARDTANQHHAEALRLLDRLVEAIQPERAAAPLKPDRRSLPSVTSGRRLLPPARAGRRAARRLGPAACACGPTRAAG
jgi:hypothetical protein